MRRRSIIVTITLVFWVSLILPCISFEDNHVMYDNPESREIDLPLDVQEHAMATLGSGHFTENLGQLGKGAGLFYCEGGHLSMALGVGWVSYIQHEEDGNGGSSSFAYRVSFEGAHAV